MPGIPLIVTAAALLDRDGRLLVQQRPAGKSMAGLWEFPGGKLEPDETPEACLIRELREELGIATDAACLAPCRDRHATCRDECGRNYCAATDRPSGCISGESSAP